MTGPHGLTAHGGRLPGPDEVKEERDETALPPVSLPPRVETPKLIKHPRVVNMPRRSPGATCARGQNLILHLGSRAFPSVLILPAALASAVPAPGRAPEPAGISWSRTVAVAISGSSRNSRSSQGGRTKPRKDV
jgi:hypothetical protein